MTRTRTAYALATLLLGGCQLALDFGPRKDSAADVGDASLGGDPADGAPREAAPPQDVATFDGAATPPDDAPSTSPPCNGDENCERVVFVTSVTYTGAMNGFAGADGHCNELAAKSTHPRVTGRTYNAWLSGNGVFVSQRLVQGIKPYVRPDGERIANDWPGFASATHLRPIDQDEHGAFASGDVWTGSDEVGAPQTENCATWSTDGSTIGTIGSTAALDADWTRKTTLLCSNTARLYCVEQ